MDKKNKTDSVDAKHSFAACRTILQVLDPACDWLSTTS